MKSSIFQNLILFLAATLIILAPLFRAGNRPLPLLILELLGLCVLLVVFLSGEQKERISKWLWIFLVMIMAVPLLYLIPLPESIVEMLSGRELYYSVAQWVSDNSLVDSSPHTASLIPEKTIDSFLSLIPVVAIFLATMSLNINKVKLLCYIFLGMAGFEALIAIAQFTNGNDALYFGMPNTGSAQGTYRNRDHFVALIEMSLPITIALLAISFSQIDKKYHHTDFISKLSLHNTLILAALVIIMLISAIFSRSRSGIFLVLFGVFISTLSFSKHVGGKHSIGVMATLSAFAVGIASSIGIIPIINRFIAVDPLEDERGRIFEHTIEAIQNFYPVGTGPGTFSSVYRAFQPVEQRSFYTNAHNDYLELFLETSVLGAVVLAMFLLIYLFGWKNVLQSPWLRFRYIQMGAGIGMFLMLLHALTDFNFHIPANMIFFAFLAGLFFHLSELAPARRNTSPDSSRSKVYVSSRGLSKRQKHKVVRQEQKLSLKTMKNPFSE